MRSDWYGGWSIGTRYLVPLLPLAIAPLVIGFERWRNRTRARCIAFASGLVVAALVELELALHRIFEWMMNLATLVPPGRDFLERSHWTPTASPLAGFWSLEVDTLSNGAIRLARDGHVGPAWRFAGHRRMGPIRCRAIGDRHRQPAGNGVNRRLAVAACNEAGNAARVSEAMAGLAAQLVDEESPDMPTCQWRAPKWLRSIPIA